MVLYRSTTKGAGGDGQLDQISAYQHKLKKSKEDIHMEIKEFQEVNKQAVCGIEPAGVDPKIIKPLFGNAAMGALQRKLSARMRS